MAKKLSYYVGNLPSEGWKKEAKKKAKHEALEKAKGEKKEHKVHFGSEPSHEDVHREIEDKKYERSHKSN